MVVIRLAWFGKEIEHEVRAGLGLLKVTYMNHSQCQSPKNFGIKSIKRCLTHPGPKRKTMAFKEKLVKWFMASIETSILELRWQKKTTELLLVC